MLVGLQFQVTLEQDKTESFEKLINGGRFVLFMFETCICFLSTERLGVSKVPLCRGDVGSLTRVGSMIIGYFSPPSERVFLWFWW